MKISQYPVNMVVYLHTIKHHILSSEQYNDQAVCDIDSYMQMLTDCVCDHICTTLRQTLVDISVLDPNRYMVDTIYLDRQIGVTVYKEHCFTLATYLHRYIGSHVEMKEGVFVNLNQYVVGSAHITIDYDNNWSAI